MPVAPPSHHYYYEWSSWTKCNRCSREDAIAVDGERLRAYKCWLDPKVVERRKCNTGYSQKVAALNLFVDVFANDRLPCDSTLIPDNITQLPIVEVVEYERCQVKERLFTSFENPLRQSAHHEDALVTFELLLVWRRVKLSTRFRRMSSQEQCCI